MPLGCLAALFGIKETAPNTAAPEDNRMANQVPDSVPVSTKRYFFSPDENAFFRVLEESLVGTPYRVFPNVRLNDLFIITDKDKSAYASARGRLNDKHVDFLIVDTSKDFQPVLALELDGRSHQRERQQYNDAVKDVVFRSAGLTLLRLPSKRYTAAELKAQLQPFIK